MKKTPVEIMPSILSADPLNLAHDVAQLAHAGVKWLHVDIMDGDFVPNLAFSPAVVASLRKKTDLSLDVHLMVRRLAPHIERFAEAGSDRLIIHPEAEDDWVSSLKQIRQCGCRAGLAVKSQTKLEVLEKAVGYIDQVTIMGVEPGFGGQSLLEGSHQRLHACRAMLPEDILVQIDGGVTAENCAALYESGADVLVAGNAILNQDDYAKAIRMLQESVAKGV